MSRAIEREVSLTLRFTTYGTQEQAEASAKNVARMLGVELHQDVEIDKVKFKVKEVKLEVPRRRRPVGQH